MTSIAWRLSIDHWVDDHGIRRGDQKEKEEPFKGKDQTQEETIDRAGNSTLQYHRMIFITSLLIRLN